MANVQLRTTAFLLLLVSPLALPDNVKIVYLGDRVFVPCPNATAIFSDKYIDGEDYHSHNCCSGDVSDCNSSTEGLSVVVWEGCNNTAMQCVKKFPRFKGELVHVLAQGRPSEVANLTATAINGSGSIYISWKPPFSLNVTDQEPDTWYKVLIEDITNADAPVSLHDSISNETHINFTIPNPDSNAIFRITVTSKNGAGESVGVPVIATFVGVEANQTDKTEDTNDTDDTDGTSETPSESPASGSNPGGSSSAVIGGVVGSIAVVGFGIALFGGIAAMCYIQTQRKKAEEIDENKDRLPKQCREDVEANDVNPNTALRLRTGLDQRTADTRTAHSDQVKSQSVGTCKPTLEETDPRQVPSEQVSSGNLCRSKRGPGSSKSRHLSFPTVEEDQESRQRSFSDHTTPQLTQIEIEIELDAQNVFKPQFDLQPPTLNPSPQRQTVFLQPLKSTFLKNNTVTNDVL